MRVVVTGGAGFIGSHVVEQLVAGGHDVVVLDSLDPAAHSRPPMLCEGVDYRWADATDARVWLDVLDGADAVCHQAAKVGLGVDFSDVCDYVHANDVGTAALLWAMHQVGFTGRLVLASSMVVYGEGAYRCGRHGPLRPGPRQRADLDRGRFEPRCPRCGDELEPVVVPEDAPLDPRNVYAATKVHQEHLVTAFAREHGVPATMLRYHNVYGPRMPRDTPYAGVASIFRSALAAGRAAQVFEDGGQRRDFVHVSDVARANLLALTAATPYDGALNVASGHPITIFEMAQVVASARSGPRPEVVGRYRLGDVRHIVADPSRAGAAIGFRAHVLPAEGLRRFADDPLRA
ncbi:MAG TPA: NAD-dependent epimerase/dehydratase family protein [Acidimicrobiales bacterium]